MVSLLDVFPPASCVSLSGSKAGKTFSLLRVKGLGFKV